MRDISCFFLLCLVMLITGCGESSQPRLRVTGASTVYPIIEMAKEDFDRTQAIRLEAQAGGSTRGFEDAIAGRNDLGAMARELTSEEAAQVNVFAIAYDGVGIIVHQSNAIEGLTTEELQRIYRKEVSNWSNFGGDEQEIAVVNKADGHATLEVFLKHTGLERAEIEADVVAGDNAQVIRVVANTKGAVGYVSMGEVIAAIEADMSVRLIKLNGVEPTIEQVADETYPLRRTLYLVSKGEPSKNAALLLYFLQSEAGRQIITRGNYVPLAQ